MSLPYEIAPCVLGLNKLSRMTLDRIGVNRAGVRVGRWLTFETKGNGLHTNSSFFYETAVFSSHLHSVLN